MKTFQPKTIFAALALLTLLILPSCDQLMGPPRVQCTDRNCPTCRGLGNSRCNNCAGRGRSQCNICFGRGMTGGVGAAATKCWKCTGTGMANCSTCFGKGMVNCYRPAPQVINRPPVSNPKTPYYGTPYSGAPYGTPGTTYRPY